MGGGENGLICFLLLPPSVCLSPAGNFVFLSTEGRNGDEKWSNGTKKNFIFQGETKKDFLIKSNVTFCAKTRAKDCHMEVG